MIVVVVILEVFFLCSFVFCPLIFRLALQALYMFFGKWPLYMSIDYHTSKNDHDKKQKFEERNKNLKKRNKNWLYRMLNTLCQKKVINSKPPDCRLSLVQWAFTHLFMYSILCKTSARNRQEIYSWMLLKYLSHTLGDIHFAGTKSENLLNFQSQREKSILRSLISHNWHDFSCCSLFQLTNNFVNCQVIMMLCFDNLMMSCWWSQMHVVSLLICCDPLYSSRSPLVLDIWSSLMMDLLNTYQSRNSIMCIIQVRPPQIL